VNPSFLRKKTQWEDSIFPERVAIGGNQAAIELLRRAYQSFDSPFFVSENYEAVELLKYFENVVDAVLISLWNEFLTIADHLGVPRLEFSRLIDCMPDRDKFRSVVRIPGQAFGMWCLPKDIAAIVHAFGSLEINVIKAAKATNTAVHMLYGENHNSSTEMFVFQDGKLKLTTLGYAYLDAARKVSGNDQQ
jgi:UDP-glucose 6-dehydrogenase